MEPIGENIDNWKWRYPVVQIKAAPLPARDTPTGGGMKEAA
jgi:hypothetical protein